MRRALLALLAAAVVAPALLALAGSPDTTGNEPVEVASLVAAGAELYAWNCAVCHGATGGGLAEAKLAFPEDERRCIRCHRPSNRIVQPLDQPFIDNDMFSIGEPPPLHGTGEVPVTLASAADPAAIFRYVRATMPRYDPGRLTDAEYRALTAFLLDMNGRAGDVPAVEGL